MYYDKLVELGIKLTKRNGSEKCKCPQCSDGRKNKTDTPLSVDINTGKYNCHNCGWHGNVSYKHRNRSNFAFYEKPDQTLIKKFEVKERAVNWFKTRCISEQTLNKFNIFTKEEWMPQTQKQENCVCFPYIEGTEIVNVKYRDGRKNFKMTKGAKLIFYNLNSLLGRKKAIIVEGEIDCLSLYEAGFAKEPIADELTGEITNPESEYGIISVPNGASKGNQKLEYLENCFDNIIELDEVIIFTDNDEAGISLRDELTRRIGVEKCRIVTYPTEKVVPTELNTKRACKDANEILMHIGSSELKDIVLKSQFIPIEGIYYVEDIMPSMLESFNKGIQIAPSTRFDVMDDYFRWKKGEINLFTGYANMGKTFFALQLMLTKSIYDGWKWAIFSPENYPANDFFDDIVEMYVGKWINEMSELEYKGALNFLNEHFFYVYPEDSHDLFSIHEKFRHLVLKKGIDGVLVDPWNQLDHLQKAYQREDQYLSEQLKDVKRFALLNSICYNIVAHPKNPNYNSDKSLPVVDMYDISGGAMWGNKVDNILSYYRPNYHINKNDPSVEIYIQKCKRKRTGGKLGDFPLTLLWSKKRYADPITNQIYCDPQIAEFSKITGGLNDSDIANGYNSITDIEF